jgi:hypothetical protein
LAFEFKGTATIHEIGVVSNEVVGALATTWWFIGCLGFHQLF